MGLGNLTPPFKGFVEKVHVANHTDSCVAGGGGGWGLVRTTPRWSPKTGSLLSDTNVTTSSSCWLNATHGTDQNSSGVEIDTSIELSLPIALPTGTGGVTLAWNGSVAAHESFVRSGGCTYNSTLIAAGATCDDLSTFSLSIGATLVDLTTNTSYCPKHFTGVCPPAVSEIGYRGALAPCMYSCNVGNDSKLRTSFNSVENITGTFHSSHSYILYIWTGTQVYVLISGWPGHGSAGVNMGKGGFGAHLNYVEIW